MAKEVKSSAVVQFTSRSLVEPVSFRQLDVATDIKDPPENWLKGHAIPKSARPPPRGQGDLPSIATANASLESVAKVDVITDAENVKKLLKMAFGGPTTSMLVHRVGKTLLIDGFDSPRTLLRLQEEDWPWLKSFMMGVLMESQEGTIPLAIGQQDMIERLMLSKFLYHSLENRGEQALLAKSQSDTDLVEPERNLIVPDPLEDHEVSLENRGEQALLAKSQSDTDLVEPERNLIVPDPLEDHEVSLENRGEQALLAKSQSDTDLVEPERNLIVPDPLEDHEVSLENRGEQALLAKSQSDTDLVEPERNLIVPDPLEDHEVSLENRGEQALLAKSQSDTDLVEPERNLIVPDPLEDHEVSLENRGEQALLAKSPSDTDLVEPERNLIVPDPLEDHEVSLENRGEQALLAKSQSDTDLVEPERNLIVPDPLEDHEVSLENRGEQALLAKSPSDTDLVEPERNLIVPDPLEDHEVSLENRGEQALLAKSPSDTDLVEPERTLIVPDPLEDHEGVSGRNPGYERKVMWTFEDITMLLGTNLPIFGCGTHPCVTLKLRDMSKPINVLTGMDYWLDQLMCNVPEVAMCYHLDGIVQKYEMVKTEDLPDLPGSSFDPEVVKSVAGNLLGFLKDKATKEGHTYWLFKAKNDEVVKLYDLSSLCTNLHGPEADTNPFTVPVGMLMYRVGRALLRDAAEGTCGKSGSRRCFNTVYRLLNSALGLMSKDVYPQVVGSVHYLLANLYLAYGTGGGGKEEDEEEEGEPGGWELDEDGWEESKQGEASSCVSLDVLKFSSQPKSYPDKGGKSPLPNSTNLDDCCKQALEHIFDGLDCSEVFLRDSQAPKEEDKEEPRVPGNRSEAIPMHYGSEAQEKATLRARKSGYAPSTPAWQTELRCVLLVQAGTAYSLLSQSSSRLGNHGRAIKLASWAFQCLGGVKAAVGESELRGPLSRSLKRCQDLEREMIPSLLVHTGDIFLLYAKSEPLFEHSKRLIVSESCRSYSSAVQEDTTEKKWSRGRDFIP